MAGVNKVILIGNLGKDPDIQYLKENIPVSKFTMATTENYKDKTGKVIALTEWHNVVLWRGLAELAHKYLVKGSQIYVEGRLKTRHWDDSNHIRRSITEIIGDNVVILDKLAQSSNEIEDEDEQISLDN
ncbi:MAG: single-stranded DNA-binding protein [Ginsengibacter sp.]